MLSTFERDLFTLFDFSFGDRVNDTFRFTNDSIFPPYSIKKFKDDKYVIELALAGYRKEDVGIKLEKNILTVKGKPSDQVEDGYESTLESTIKRSKFTRSFTLQKGVEVCSSKLEDGLLKIYLNKIIPEDELPKTIIIE
jgi:molecular chaperone IbpA